ncbi:MAG: flagellin lysine-N-methylase [Alphaproteobacteria bacterium]|nr:flagellin lysine-N-methylase [Alphaproteobacteria bacterium]
MEAQRIALLDRFKCTGAACEDTCCRGWGMQVDAAHVDLYREKAPELMSAIVTSGGAHIMKRDEATGFCVKFSDGLCGVQSKYGESFLGDACNFYPRVTRRLGARTYMAATLSCPEIARLALSEANPFARNTVALDRLPAEVKGYLPDGLTEAQGEAVMEAFAREAAREDITPEQAMLHIVSTARSLGNIPVKSWPEAATFFMRTAGDRQLKGSPHPADPYRLLHSLAVLVGAGYPKMGKRFQEVFARMEQALEARMDWKNLLILNNSPELKAFAAMTKKWEQGARAKMAPVLRRWIQAQLAMALFPFAGAGGNPLERASIIAVRFALLRLALISHMGAGGEAPEEAEVIKIIQGLSRFLDHLENAELSLALYTDAEWLRESRMVGLIDL